MEHFSRFSFSRWVGILLKEFIQLKRDRLTFGMIVGIPIIQLLLFGFAINSDPKHLPTAVVMADPGPFARAYVAAMRTVSGDSSTTGMESMVRVASTYCGCTPATVDCTGTDAT